MIRRMGKGRLEAFSDGVFAIAITLLVLTIAEPDSYRHLADDLGDRWPSLAAYVVSFAVIGIMWLNHHSVFSRVGRVDRGLVYLNLFLLMTVVFLPYPTGVFGQALRQGHGEQTAAVFYSITMGVNALAWASLWLYVSQGRRLLEESFPESERMRTTVAFVGGAALYSVVIVIAFVNAFACLAAHGALALYYAFDPISQRSRRAAAGAAEQPGG